MSCVYKIYLRVGGGWSVEGRDNVPLAGPVILVPNHVSLLDPPLVGVTSPCRPYIMAKAELFHGIAGWAIERMGSFPVKRGGGDRRALRQARALLADGQVLLLFPEGTRSRDGELGPPEPGVALLAHAAKAAVVPVFIGGTETAFSKTCPGFGWASPTIRYGKPLDFEDEYARKADRDTLEGIAAAIMTAIGALRPASTARPAGSNEPAAP